MLERNKIALAGLAASAVLAASAGVAWAQVVDLTGNIVNPSFETPDTATATIVDFPGWGQGTDTGVNEQGQVGAPAAASSGTQMSFLGNGTAFTNIFQDVPNVGQAGANVTGYQFTIGLAIRTTDPATNGTINVGIDDLTAGEPVAITGVPRASLTNTFQDFSVVLPSATVTSGETLRLFVDKQAGNTLIVADNARFVAVPEPASLGLLAVGGLLALRRRRRRRHA